MSIEPPLIEALNCRWSRPDRLITWNHVWKSLWVEWGLARLIVWRILNHAYFSNSRGARWGVTPNICPVCRSLRENMNHMFFECDQVNLGGGWLRHWFIIHLCIIWFKMTCFCLFRKLLGDKGIVQLN